MNSKIEQVIEEIEEYIEGCKSPMFSKGSQIVVDKETIDELLTELRMKTPEEIKRYQKIISNKEAILADANAKAQEIIKQAQAQNSAMVSEHEVMQQAYAQANEVVMIATKQAQEILDNATNDANAIRMSAITYTDDMLKNMEEIISGSIETSKARTDSFVTSLQGYLDIVKANRSELVPQELEAEQKQQARKAQQEQQAQQRAQEAAGAVSSN